MRRSRPPDVKLERIENGVGVGTPDIHALCNSFASWVELKATNKPPVRANTPVLGSDGLSIEQRNWHMTWFQHGGISFILVGVGTEQFLLPGYMFDAVNGLNMNELRTSAIASDWSEIFQRLRGY